MIPSPAAAAGVVVELLARPPARQTGGGLRGGVAGASAGDASRGGIAGPSADGGARGGIGADAASGAGGGPNGADGGLSDNDASGRAPAGTSAGTPGGAPAVLAAAVAAFGATSNFRDAILYAANLGGDSDVIAAVCGQLAGAYYSVKAIPTSWHNGLMHKELIADCADRLLAHAMLGLSD